MDIEIQYFVIISERAENNLDNIVNYLLIEWNEKVKDESTPKSDIARHCESPPNFFGHNVNMTGREYTFPGNPEGIEC